MGCIAGITCDGWSDRCVPGKSKIVPLCVCQIVTSVQKGRFNPTLSETLILNHTGQNLVSPATACLNKVLNDDLEKIEWLEKSQTSRDKGLLKIVQLTLIWRSGNIFRSMASGALSGISFCMV